MATLREQIVAKARAQLGTPYYSMNFSAKDGYAGWMGTNLIGKGWGCAQLTSYCYNTVLGTKYVGSCYNYAGDALGQSENQGGGQFRFIDASEALPGDAVLYGAKGHDGKDYDDYGHIAIYIGDGKVIGAMGSGKPNQSGYLNIGISETTIAKQNIGGVTRYIRCAKLDDEAPEIFPVKKTITVVSAVLNVRSSPTVSDSTLVTSGGKPVQYKQGDAVNIDGVVFGSDGRLWGHYIGGNSGKDRYISLGTLENVR